MKQYGEPMVITFLDINASYSHASLALPMLANACSGIDTDWQVVKGTVNDQPGDLAVAVQATQPDIILATFYLFTHQPLMKIIKRAHVLCPEALIVLGGPEFLGNNERFLRLNPMVNAVVKGEGELPLKSLLEQKDIPSAWSDIPGLCFINADGNYCSSPASPAPWPPPKLPYESPFYDWSKPFIQVESSRGCNQACGFCTSAQTGGPHWLSLDNLRSWLCAARQHGVTDIRMLDRTFNASPKQCLERLQMFITDFSEMRFHLEIHPAFLPDSLRDTLRNAPQNMFHLEVGIQSTSLEASAHSMRAGSRQQVIDGLAFLCECENLAVHTDLISGLPGCSYMNLINDINELLRLKPDEIQLETLKILPGTDFHERHTELGLLFAEDPPYEILESPGMSSAELKDAELLSKLIDRFYNTPMLQPVFQDAFAHNERLLTDFMTHVRTHLAHPISEQKRARLFFDYLSACDSPAKWTLAYQWLLKGFSPSQCPVPVMRWTGAVPSSAAIVYNVSDEVSEKAPVWVLDTPDNRFFFVLDKGVTQSGPARIMCDRDFPHSFPL